MIRTSAAFTDPVTEGLLPGAGGPADANAMLLAILSHHKGTVLRYVEQALPPSCSAAQYIARLSALVAEDGPAAPPARPEPAAPGGRPDGLAMLRRVLAAAPPRQRQRWEPLDVERLLAVLPPAGEGAALPDTCGWENLTVLAPAGAPGPFADAPQYAAFFDGLCRALHRSAPRHALLVRDRGVGERAVLLELAARGRAGDPPFLRGRQVVRVDFRHTPRDRAADALAAVLALAPEPPQELVLCLDNAVPLLAALQGHGGGAHALTVALARTPHRVVCAATPEERDEHFADGSVLAEQFSAVPLPEPEPALARRLVRHYAGGLEAHFGVVIDDDAIERAVALSDSYVLHERLPAKAVKVLRAICDDVDYDRTQRQAAPPTIGGGHVLAKLAQITGVPAATLAGVGEGVNYRKAFGDVIVGQPHAVEEVARELGLIRAGMADPGKPASVMMFVGQTGTGKTEMAKALARVYSASRRLKTFTLGNFSEPHSVSGIIGVPAGYVGHDQGGRLINELNADPYGVFLLDEADKAHPDVMQPFLNLFDEGWIADQRGKKAYAQRAIFILTTNVGQRQIADMCRAGKGTEEIAATMKDLLSRIRHSKSNRPVFTPEFLARVKRFVIFRSLDEAAMVGVCRRLVADLQATWRDRRRKDLAVPAGLAAAIGRRAFALDDRAQGREGGRIVRKLIADLVECPLQDAISAQPDAYRQAARVTVDWAEPPDPSAAPRVAVRFERAASAAEGAWTR